MSLSNWLSQKLNLHPDPARKAERTELVRETYDRVTEVRKLRENVLEGRDFPIASFLRGETPAVNRRVKK